ncbi:uncharacterized protein LOC135289508 [Passer domesticus]|uniref:uncharacterized protein LOC135289508 n=1 Tax=Passer domesticus TaxID=48849 RepID=UPI0030FE66BA
MAAARAGALGVRGSAVTQPEQWAAGADEVRAQREAVGDAKCVRRAPGRPVVPFTHRALAVSESKNDLSKKCPEMFIWYYHNFLYNYTRKNRLKVKGRTLGLVLGAVLRRTLTEAVDEGQGRPGDGGTAAAGPSPVAPGREGAAAAQGDRDRLEKGADRNLRPFSVGRTKSCSWEQPQAPARAGECPAGKRFVRKGPGAPAGHRSEHKPATCAC